MSIYIKSQNAAALNVTVTNTATSLFSLIATAQGGGATEQTVRDYYNKKGCDAIVIYPEDGDVRLALAETPTASVGFLLKQATYFYLSGVDLADMNLIRTSGNVKVSLFIVKET